MIEARYNAEKEHDEMLDLVIKGIRQSMQDNDDDALIMCVGSTGTGKSSLMLHAYESYDPEGCSVENVGMTRESHAEAMMRVQNQPGYRFCCNDEANISKRDHSTKYNKDLLDLYMAIRGKKIFHWWNHPVADMIDKPFIEERIKGLILVTTKDKDRPRIYYYFTKKSLLQIWEKYGNLKTKTLKRYRKQYAVFKGWFRAYKGKMWGEYLSKKEDRMTDKISEFYKKYGKGDTMSIQGVGDKLKVNRMTAKKYLDLLEKDGTLIQGEDYQRSAIGYPSYTQSALIKVKQYLANRGGG